MRNLSSSSFAGNVKVVLRRILPLRSWYFPNRIFANFFDKNIFVLLIDILSRGTGGWGAIGGGTLKLTIL